MLCSICNKNTAVVFVNKPSPDGNSKLEGLCYECAKKKGINPIDTLVKQANLSESDIEDMTRQFEDMFKDISGELDNINPEDLGLNDNGDLNSASLGSIFSGIFNNNPNSSAEDKSSSSSNTKKVKVEKKNNTKKKKALDTYGTNLTYKAKNNELDNVIGRDKEIQRIIQILNRRSKNNPCLIGEPGVGKTAIARRVSNKNCKWKSTCQIIK